MKPSVNMSGGVAQLVEQRTENPRVTSSILVLATIFFCSDAVWTPQTAFLCLLTPKKINNL